MFAKVLAVSLWLNLVICSHAEAVGGDLENIFTRGAPTEARRMLLELGDEGVAFLTNRFHSPDYQIASRAVEVFCYGFAGDSTEEGKTFVAQALPGLMTCISDEGDAIRSRALWLIGNLGRKGEPAVDLLLAAAQQSESSRYIIKKAAIKSIGEIRSRPERCLPVLDSLLDHEDAKVVEYAIRAIGLFESEALSYRPRLQALAQTDDEKIATTAKTALERLKLRPAPEAGDSAPDFSLSMVSGSKNVRLSNQRGKLVLLDFWSTTCPPCMAPLEKYEHLLAKNQEAWKEKIAIIAISIDSEVETVRRHLKSKGWNRVTHLWNTNQEEVTRAYRIHGLPDTLLIDASGVILWRGHPADLDFETKATEWIAKASN